MALRVVAGTVRAVLSLLALGTAAAAAGQPSPQAEQPAESPWSLDLTVHDVGIGIGNSKHVDGLRLNFRDVAPYVVHGVNLTVWSPASPAAGIVNGLALGVPVTGAAVIRGVALGVGLGAVQEIDGIGLGVLGLGAGGALRGIFASGLGIGSGGDVDGVLVGGLGAGCRGRLRGIAVGGLGVGCGGDAIGLLVGGLGAGVAGRLTGIGVGGLGIGSGEGIDGLAVGVLGVGTGGDVRGLLIGGLGAGAAGTIRGAVVAGLGAGAPRVRGGMAALVAGGEDVMGVVLAPAYFELRPGGTMSGVSISAFNRIRGAQHGLAIGIVNYTPELHGVQIGLVNWAGNNAAGLQLLPIVNAHID